MSDIPNPDKRFSIRVVRAVVITLIFLCSGTLFQFVLTVIIFAVLWGNPWQGVEGFAIWALGAALTGLVVGIYDATYDRVGARAVFVSSLVMVLVALILVLGGLISMFIGTFGHDTMVYEIFFLLAFLVVPGAIPFAMFLVCFVVSMMASWKVLDIVRDRMPVVWWVLPP